MYKKSNIIESIEKIEEQFSEKEEGLEYYNKKTQLLLFLGYILMILYNALIVMLGYNWIIPNISNLPTINYIQAILLDFFVSFITTTKFSDDDLYERSFIYRIARIFYIIALDTVILLVMFILQLFI